MPRILLVEDEPSIADTLLYALRSELHEVSHVMTGKDALALQKESVHDLAILDVGLPDMTGFELCRKLRETSAIPILFLTARDSELDRVLGLEIGGDDYVTKPFSPRELVARVRALLRRSGAPEGGIIEHGAMRLDLNAHHLSINGNSVTLGPTEFRLLEHFMTNPGRAFDRSTLLDRVWGRSVYVEERTVDVHILRLRKVLQPHGLQHVVQTVRGVGYRYLQPE